MRKLSKNSYILLLTHESYFAHHLYLNIIFREIPILLKIYPYFLNGFTLKFSKLLPGYWLNHVLGYQLLINIEKLVSKAILNICYG